MPPPGSLPTTPKGTEAKADYHAALGTVLSSLKDAQDLKEGLAWRFNKITPTSKNGEPTSDKYFRLRFPILFIMGDTEGHNKLVAIKGGQQTDLKCRLCRVPDKDLDNAEFKVANHLTTTANFDHKNNCVPKGAIAPSYHLIKNNFLRRLQHCDSERGLEGAVVPEPLHQWQLGMLSRGVNQLAIVQKLKANGQKKERRGIKVDRNAKNALSTHYVFGEAGDMTTTANKFCHEIGHSLMRQSYRNLPKTHFGNGYLPNPKEMQKDKDASTHKRCGNEMPGVILSILLFLLCDSIIDGVRVSMGAELWSSWIDLLSVLMLTDHWMKKSTYTEEELVRTTEFLKAFMNSYKKTVNRTEGRQMRIIKFHLNLHVVDTVRQFGAIRNVNGCIGESMLKTNIKATGRRTNVASDGFEKGTSNRSLEQIAIGRAAYEVFQSDPDRSILKDYFSQCPDESKDKKRQAQAAKFEENECSQDFGRSICVVIQGDGHPCFDLKKNAWDSLKRKWQGQLEVTELLNFVHSLNVKPGGKVILHTEHEGNTVKYRAHPCFMGHPWQDWCLAEVDGKIFAAQLLMFFRVEGDFEHGDDRSDSSSSTDNEWLHEVNREDAQCALVHHLNENPISKDIQLSDDEYNFFNYKKPKSKKWNNRLVDPNCPFVYWGVKAQPNMDQKLHVPQDNSKKNQSKLKQQWKEKWEAWELIRPSLQVIRTKDIKEPLIGVRCPCPSFPHQYMFLDPKEEWERHMDKKMVDIIEEAEAAGGAEEDEEA